MRTNFRFLFSPFIFVVKNSLMRAVLLPGLLLFLLSACTSPQQQLQQVEADMVDLLGPNANWKIPAQTGDIWLPLPPPAEVQADQQARAQQILADAAKIDTTALAPDQNALLKQYRQALMSLADTSAGWPLDPLNYTLAEPLQRCLAEPDGESLILLLEKMPAYYTEVEQRWRSTHRHNYAPAVQQCLITIDNLEELEKDKGKYPADVQTRLQELLPLAQAALKNYLGQCRSLVLE